MLTLHNIAHLILFSAYILSYFIDKYNSFGKILLHNGILTAKKRQFRAFAIKQPIIPHYFAII